MKALRTIAAIVALGALAVCLAAPLRVLLGEPAGVYADDFNTYVGWFNGATIVWFVSAPLWLIPELLGRRGKREK